MSETVVVGEDVELSIGGGKKIAEDDWTYAVGKAARQLGHAIGVERLAVGAALNGTVDLIGFYVAWHLFGGAEGLERLGMPRSQIYRKVNNYRQAFGKHPDEHVLPGVDVDPAPYLVALASGETLPRVLAINGMDRATFVD